jgi:hypothetical protein
MHLYSKTCTDDGAIAATREATGVVSLETRDVGGARIDDIGQTKGRGQVDVCNAGDTTSTPYSAMAPHVVVMWKCAVLVARGSAAVCWRRRQSCSERGRGFAAMSPRSWSSQY